MSWGGSGPRALGVLRTAPRQIPPCRVLAGRDLRAGGSLRRRRTQEQVQEVARREREDWDERHLNARKSARLREEESEVEND